MSNDAPEVEIDWEARCGQMATENMRSAAKSKAKIIQQGEEVQELKRTIAALRADVARMVPAQQARLAAEETLDNAQRRWAERYNEKDKIISELKAQVAKGKRGALELAIGELQAEANRMARLEAQA